MEEIVIVMGGSFNPPTAAHEKLLLAAVEQLGATRGLFVPSSGRYVRRKLARSGESGQVLPEKVRLEMLEAMARDDPRLAVDDLEYHRQEKAYTYETMLDLQQKYPHATLYFLAGGDKVHIFPKWHRIREFLDQFHIIVVKRDGEDPARAIAENAFLRQYQDRFHVIQAPEGIEGVSSSAVRELLREGKPGGEALCHPQVWKMLQEQADLPRTAICRFRDEYLFLSNFYLAPVTYRGLTYQNNEAAFQAQKCLTREEQLPFTTLRPNEAKRLGRQVALRPDWEDVKLQIMEEIVRAKFTQNPELKEQLLATGDLLLMEGNTWHDLYWGVDSKTWEGQNHLGEILMQVRREFREEL